MDVRVPAGDPLPDDGAFPASSPYLTRLPDDDFDLDGHIDWLVREIDEGRQHIPPEPAIEGPAISVSLGDACDVDSGLLAAMCGPDGMGGEAVSATFRQDAAADALHPGPVLAALTAQAAASTDCLTDNELVGVLQAARRLENLAAFQQTVVIAEFARRRQAEFEAAKAAGVPVGCRDGEFPGEGLAMELIETGAYAGTRIDTAIELTSRLPRTLAAMADGTVDLGRAVTIAARTRVMSDGDAAWADEVLAAVAAGLRPDQLARKAAALELKLAPDAVGARKELARHLGQRVEARREESGNASLAGRELGTADVVASKAYIDAIAVKLRESGLGGTLANLRALVLVDLTQGRDPLDRVKPQLAAEPPADSSGDAPQSATSSADASEPVASPPGDPLSDTDSDGWPTPDGETRNAGLRDALADESDDGSLHRGPVRHSHPAPLPALINLLVPAATLLGWGTAPAQATGWGLLDAGETRAFIQAASQHPRARWCATVIAPDGTAIAHACAKGQHRWKPPGPASPQTAQRPRGAPALWRWAHLADLLRGMNATFEPIARDACDHRHAEDRYAPSRKLKHLLRARTQTCSAPACNAQAVYCDIDHTVPYPDGPTCECNTNPKCRRHHRTKQASGWKTAQPTPGTAAWTTPSGRTHTTKPTVYDL